MYLVGTSGYNYPEWKGTFYPAALPAARMLAHYASRLPSVEINYTFYRMPNARVVSAWAEESPAGFRFSLKAPRRITHIARLHGCEEVIRAFGEAAAPLGRKLGVLLFQLGPTHKKDVNALDACLRALPPRARAAFEFRHPSWFEDEVFARLRDANAALCVADGGKLSTPVEITADFAYFRLRDEGYGPADLERWSGTIREATPHCSDVFVYFKHEEAGKGPEFASRMQQLLAAA
jgi:uncharacterized protein YecE (DUF72 family)